MRYNYFSPVLKAVLSLPSTSSNSLVPSPQPASGPRIHHTCSCLCRTSVLLCTNRSPLILRAWPGPDTCRLPFLTALVFLCTTASSPSRAAQLVLIQLLQVEPYKDPPPVPPRFCTLLSGTVNMKQYDFYITWQKGFCRCN